MRWMGTLALLAAVATADNDPRAQVKRLAGGVADAQRRGDLLAEQAAWEALRDVRLDEAQYRDACAEVMKLLDSERNGAYLSAHLLALELVRAAVREGDDRHLADAAAVLSAPRKDAGACAATLAELAAGVVAARKDQPDAMTRLTTAFDAALKNEWFDLATHAGIELACESKRVGREGDILKRLNAALRQNGDIDLLFRAQEIVAKRIPDATFTVPDVAGAPGGAGGAGRAGEESPVGAAWNLHPLTKPLIVVRRTAKGFEIEPQFKGAGKGGCGLKWGVHHWDRGGITLAFYGEGVALRMIDPTGGNGQPGDGALDKWSVFYLLAPGETWSVTKQGVVSVKK